MTREEIKQVKMTNQEAIEILRDTPIDLRSPREDDIHTLCAKAQMMAIEALQERPKGRWIRKTRFMGDCSECGITASISCNFCPCCGADMRESD